MIYWACDRLSAGLCVSAGDDHRDAGRCKNLGESWIFIGSALFAYLTVLISSMKPAKIAGRVSPMEALRYTDGETVSKRKTKRSAENAGIPRMALANLGRNKKRTVTVICSLILGLVLLSCVYGKTPVLILINI